MSKPIIIASDHAGYEMKEELIKYMKSEGISFLDLGPDSAEAVDYADFGHKIGESISKGSNDLGISICGSGNGINMTTNKHIGVRGAICWNEEIAEMARRHNDANVCALPARYIDLDTAKRILDIYLNTPFDGGRHERRINKIDIK